MNSATNASQPARSASSNLPSTGLSRSRTPSTAPSSISGTTSSARDCGSQAIWPANWRTSGTTIAVRRAAAVKIKSGPIQIGQPVPDQRRHIGGIGEGVGFALHQRRQLCAKILVNRRFARCHWDFRLACRSSLYPDANRQGMAKGSAMDDYIDPALLGPEEKFAIGQPVPRAEDPVLLRGAGHYADDISLPGQAYAVMVRSHLAHGRIRGIDTAAARAMPGVLAVYTAADLERGGIGPLPPRQVMNGRDGKPMLMPTHYALPKDKVRYVGEAVAVVVAETQAQARDAAELVGLEIDPLPAVTEPACADAPDAPVLYDEVPANVGLDFHFGDSEKVTAAFANAAHVTKLRLRNNRIIVNAMEPRAAVADYDSERGHWTLFVGCQGVFGFRNYVAQVCGVGRDKVRVLTERVGGSFGMKQPTFPEYYCILHAARELRRPVKWTDDRSGSFVSDTHGRDADFIAELALDRDGNVTALRLTGYGDLGAYYGAPGPSTRNAVRNTLGVYKTPLIEVSTKCVFTNTTPVGAYRGAGRPEANYYMERLVDTAARELGIDRVELRRKNHIPAEAMPYKAPNGTIYDSGDFTNLLNDALKLAD